MQIRNLERDSLSLWAYLGVWRCQPPLLTRVGQKRALYPSGLNKCRFLRKNICFCSRFRILSQNKIRHPVALQFLRFGSTSVPLGGSVGRVMPILAPTVGRARDQLCWAWWWQSCFLQRAAHAVGRHSLWHANALRIAVIVHVWGPFVDFSRP